MFIWIDTARLCNRGVQPAAAPPATSLTLKVFMLSTALLGGILGPLKDSSSLL